MRRTITIDHDIYDFLLDNIREFGEDESAVLRRLLGLPGSGTNGGDPTHGEPAARSALTNFLESAEFRLARNATDRFLAILGFAYRTDAEGFERLLEVSGRKRRYFARSSREIATSGTSTHPRQIPGSDYWALTNADTSQKKDLLRKALTVLGHGTADIRRALNALE